MNFAYFRYNFATLIDCKTLNYILFMFCIKYINVIIIEYNDKGINDASQMN